MTSGNGWNLWVCLAGGGCGWNLWVWLRGCKKVYIFPQITYPYSSCICSFLQQHHYFFFIFKIILRSSSNIKPVVKLMKIERTCDLQ